MPIKKHVCQIKENNTLQIPKTIVDALGISTNSVVRCFSNNDGYSFKVELVPSFENVKMLDEYKSITQQLRERIKELEAENRKLRENL